MDKTIRVKNGKLGDFAVVVAGKPLGQLNRCALLPVLDPAEIPGVSFNRSRYNIERKPPANPDFFKWCIHDCVFCA